MIIKNLAAMCRKKKRVYVFEDEARDIQWVGDGSAIYPMYGIPHMEDEQMLILFDVPEDKRKTYAVFHHEEMLPGYSVEDGAADNLVENYPISIGEASGVWYPVSTSSGIAFYAAEVFKPIMDKPQAKLYERYTRKGDLYFVAKDGMLVEALIFPAQIKEEELAATLGQICDQLDVKLEQEREARESAGE